MSSLKEVAASIRVVKMVLLCGGLGEGSGRFWKGVVVDMGEGEEEEEKGVVEVSIDDEE